MMYGKKRHEKHAKIGAGPLPQSPLCIDTWHLSSVSAEYRSAIVCIQSRECGSLGRSSQWHRLKQVPCLSCLPAAAHHPLCEAKRARRGCA
eukprot:4330087-Prymnesium_polylepis.1